MLKRAEQISCEKDDAVKAYLTSKNQEDRAAAAYVIGEKKLPFRNELITALGDSNKLTQQAARRSLILLANFAVTMQGEATKATSTRVRELTKIGPNSRAQWDVDA